MAVTGSIQTKNGMYYVVLYLYNEDGKRKPKWINTKLPIKDNKRKAERMLMELLEEWDQKQVPYSDLTFAEYMERWLKEIEPQVKRTTYRSYCGNAYNHIIPYFKKRKLLLQELKPFHLEEYYRSKLEAGSKLKTEEALSTVTIRHHHQNISKALSDAVHKGLIATNPAAAAKPPRAEKFKGKFLNPQELEKLLLLFSGSVVELPVKMCAVYGFRRSEVLGLKWSHVDFDNRTITICETLQQNVGGNYTDTPKTEGSYRTLPMTDSIYEMLKRHRENQEKRRKIMGNYYVENDYVCTWPNGKVIEPNYLTRTFHSIVSKSDLPEIRLHDLRHSAASNLLNMGFSVVQVAEWLGHESATTTLRFYSHVDASSKKAIANTLEQALKVG